MKRASSLEPQKTSSERSDEESSRQERLHELPQAQHADRGVVDAERPGEIAAARALTGIQPKIRFITGTIFQVDMGLCAK